MVYQLHGTIITQRRYRRVNVLSEMNKINSIVLVLVCALLINTHPSGCFLPKLRSSLNKLISQDRLKEMRHSLISSPSSVIRTQLDNSLDKLRLFYINKFSIKVSLRSTITVSSVSTTVISTALYCARIQNLGVTGACSRRRKELSAADLIEYNNDNDIIQPTQVIINGYLNGRLILN